MTGYGYEKYHLQAALTPTLARYLAIINAPLIDIRDHESSNSKSGEDSDAFKECSTALI